MPGGRGPRARATAATAPATSSTTKPVTPSVITSGTEPRRKATTGVPHAIASIITRPNGSGQSIGKSTPCARPRNASLAAPADLADELDLRPGLVHQSGTITCW